MNWREDMLDTKVRLGKYKVELLKNGEKNYSIEDQQRLITMIQKIQRLSKEASDTLNNLENPFTELLD